MPLIGPYETGLVHQGDSLALCEAIPDASIDLILCDPVYWEIEQYRWLGQLGRRVLKPGRYLIAQEGTYYLFQAMLAVAENLDYYWMLHETLDGPLQFFARKIFQLHKPFLWFANGLDEKYERRWVNDRLHSPRSKRYHRWGDGVGTFLPLIERLTNPGDVVLDPFTGGGTVPVACKMIGRHCLAFEIDPEKATQAQARLAATTPPLLPDYIEQGVLL